MSPWRIQSILRSLVLLSLCLGLAACQALNPAPTSEATPTEEVEVVIPPEPTETPRPPGPQVVLLAPSGADGALAGQLQTLLNSLSLEAGLRFMLLPALQDTDRSPDLRLVVVLAPDPGVAGLAAALPQAQFLAIGIPGLQAGGNLSAISGGERPDQQAFLAGYLAAMFPNECRVAVITLADSPAGKAAHNGFVNGVRYYCGSQQPGTAPNIYPLRYPLFAELPKGSSQGEQQGVVEYLRRHGVKTVYVYSEAGDDSLLDYLAISKMTMIGGRTPTEKAREYWAATIRSDLLQGVKDLWPRLLAGQGGTSLDVPLGFVDINPAIFSPGKQSMAAEFARDLLSGFVDTGVDPQTGELR